MKTTLPTGEVRYTYENEVDVSINKGVKLILIRILVAAGIGLVIGCSLVYGVYRAYLHLFPQR